MKIEKKMEKRIDGENKEMEKKMEKNEVDT